MEVDNGFFWRQIEILDHEQPALFFVGNIMTLVALKKRLKKMTPDQKVKRHIVGEIVDDVRKHALRVILLNP